jgi:glycerol uptake facilitator-like aquaporin
VSKILFQEKIMSRVRVSKTDTSAIDKKKRNEWPAVVFFWAFGLAIVAYVTARIVLDSSPHPYHWLAGVVGAILGVGIGWLWYRWRGDIF